MTRPRLRRHPWVRVARSGQGRPSTTRARRAGPREHGRQAARSKRDQPGGHMSRTTGLASPHAAAGGVLDPIEDNSAKTLGESCAVPPDA
jgi:hypothetical protein